MKSTVVLGVMVLGFALLVVSSLWSHLFPPTSSWTQQKAARMSEVKAQINNLGAQLYLAESRTYGGQDPGELKAEYNALQEEFEQLKADFESATETPQTVSTVLKWTGISLAALGIIGWYAVKQTE
jgi:hypothetical protein